MHYGIKRIQEIYKQPPYSIKLFYLCLVLFDSLASFVIANFKILRIVAMICIFFSVFSLSFLQM